MKRLLLGAAGLAVAMSAVAPASAADLPVPYKTAAPMIPAVYDWSGFYIGLNGGGGSARKCWDISNNGIAINAVTVGVLATPFNEGCHNATGFLGGAQMGYRLQSGGWVFGIEGQGDWTSFKGSNTSLFYGPPILNQSRVNALGLFTGQVGYAWNNVLWYVKGGGALTSDRYNGINATSNVFYDAATEIRWGGTVGTGVEFAFAPGWSVAFEYDHLFMGTRSNSFTSSFATVTPFGGSVTSIVTSRVDGIQQNVDIGTIRVNYRWGGPAIAKY
jgi:outer membrane immunogenic protein